MEIKKITIGLIEANCYLLISGKEMIIVDPGADPEKILAEIASSNAKPECIINTHYHPDHTGANEFIKKETKAKILIHELEKDFISFEADGFLKDGDKIKIGNEQIEIIHTPGHSLGGICILGKDFLLTGDTVFKEGYGRTDFRGGSWDDLNRSLEKIKKLFKPDMKIYPGHGDSYRIKLSYK